MTTPPPIACTLNVAEMPSRLAEIRDIGDTALRSWEATQMTALLRFTATDDTRERLQAIVDAESACCAFMDFNLTEAAGALVLSIRSPDGGAHVMHELVAAFRGETA